VIRTGGTMLATDRQIEELLVALNGIKKGM
jgi:hypothetical protein